MEGDIQEQQRLFEAMGKRPIGLDSAFCAENGLCSWRPFLLFRFLLGAQKKMKTGLRTTKSRVY